MFDSFIFLGNTTRCATHLLSMLVVILSAELSATSMSADAQENAAALLTSRHNAARKHCMQLHEGTHSTARTTTALSHGGWCLGAPIADHPAHLRHSGGVVELPHNQTFALPQGHYVADGGVVAVLAKILQTGQSVNDFGAGVGEYGHALKAINESIAWRGYDGAGNIEEYTNGFVRFFDLTVNLSLPRADWVLSLEVGEHIPRHFEQRYMRNLNAHNCRGIIGSWARPGQSGIGHVNTRNRTDVLGSFMEMGYRADERLLAEFVGAKHPWTYPLIRQNLFVVVRENPTCRADF